MIKEATVSKGLDSNGGIELVLLKAGENITGLSLIPKTPDAKMRCAVIYHTIDELSLPQWRVFMGIEKIAIRNPNLDGRYYEWRLTAGEAVDLTMALDIDIQDWEKGTGLGNIGIANYNPITSEFMLICGRPQTCVGSR